MTEFEKRRDLRLTGMYELAERLPVEEADVHLVKHMLRMAYQLGSMK